MYSFSCSIEGLCKSDWSLVETVDGNGLQRNVMITRVQTNWNTINRESRNTTKALKIKNLDREA